jgi:hypothetical protein
MEKYIIISWEWLSVLLGWKSSMTKISIEKNLDPRPPH